MRSWPSEEAQHVAEYRFENLAASAVTSGNCVFIKGELTLARERNQIKCNGCNCVKRVCSLQRGISLEYVRREMLHR